MPPIKAIKNQYVGINAHLHSYWQAVGGWHEFHTAYIVQLAAILNAQLVPKGYKAGIEQSLQLRLDDLPLGEPESDITIYDMQRRSGHIPPQSLPVETTVVPIAELMELVTERAEYRALAVYSIREGKRGEVVGWMELLSPSNKGNGSGANEYMLKRQALVQRSITFIEIDYLNNTPPTIARFRDGNPYRIIMIDPHPDSFSGTAYSYSFGVDDTIPTIEIPLKSSDKLMADFAIPYHQTIESQFFAHEFVDYSQTPEGMNFYNSENQKRIFARIRAIELAVRAGIDLEKNAPLPVEPM
jgi:hypothetical protein